MSGQYQHPKLIPVWQRMGLVAVAYASSLLSPFRVTRRGFTACKDVLISATLGEKERGNYDLQLSCQKGRSLPIVRINDRTQVRLQEGMQNVKRGFKTP